MEKCEGQDGNNKKVLLATRVVSINPKGRGELYSNEHQLSFKKYRTKLREAYSMLTCNQNVVPAHFLV